MEPFSKHVLFQKFCELCEQVKSIKDVSKNSSILKNYFISYQNDAVSKNMDKNLFPILRMFLPQEDRDRGPYGIKEFALAKIYIRVLSLPKNGPEAQKLINYKAPTSSQSAVADFAEVAYWVLKSRCKDSGNYSIKDIEDFLDRIANFNSENQPRLIDAELTKLISNTTALQQKWLIRLILKDLNIGFGRGKIFNCFHVDALDLFDCCNSLSKVCSTLHSPAIRLNEIEIELFSPFRPMLSDRLDISKVANVVKDGIEYFIETKFDGERFQMHMKDNVFKYFSRRAFDYTENYGCDFSSGIFTIKLKHVFKPEVKNFIVDGEMMGWHKTKEIFSSKGVQFDVKKITINSHYQPCFCVFDILMYNDKILTNLPLNERLTYLDNLFEDEKGVIIKSKRSLTISKNDILNSLNEAIDSQDEGIIIKQTQSFYKPNSRKSGWFKIKPEYTEGAMNELDLLIIGGYYSENKKHGLIGSVMLGVAIKEPTDNTPTSFYSIGRVKLSLAADDVEELCSKLKPHWNIVDKLSECPEGLYWTKDKPDLWIKPQDSYILQIKASELVKSNVFKTSYTLRFPRIEKVRFDKPWYDCLSLEEFENLTKTASNVEKLTTGHISKNKLDDKQDVSPKKKSKILRVLGHSDEIQNTTINKISSLLEGKEICVLTGNERATKQNLEMKIIENGGKITQNPGPSTFCIVAGDMNARVRNAIKSEIHCVASVDWLMDSLHDDNISSGKIFDWIPKYLLGMSREVRENFTIMYDKYQDSYRDNATIETLKHSLSVCTDHVDPLTAIEFEYVDKLLFNRNNPYAFMRPCHAYFVDSLNEVKRFQLLQAEFRVFGGQIKNDTELNFITHVIVPENPVIEKLLHIRNEVHSLVKKPQFVQSAWLNQCLSSKKVLNVENYLYQFFVTI